MTSAHCAAHWARFRAHAGSPTAIICHTVKGKGLPAAESNADWHHKNKLTDSELDAIRVAVGDF